MKNGRRYIDLAGQKFGRLLCTAPAGLFGASTDMRWHCVCDCGAVSIANGCMLRSGKTKSCGCLAKELVAKRSVASGQVVAWNGKEVKIGELAKQFGISRWNLRYRINAGWTMERALQEQVKNKRQTQIKINGLCFVGDVLVEEKILRASLSATRQRLQRGWDVERAILEEPQKNRVTPRPKKPGGKDAASRRGDK